MCGERELWNAVILHAVEDLFSDSYWEQRDAFVWFFRNNPDYFRICDYAEIDPMCLRKKVFDRIINGR